MNPKADDTPKDSLKMVGDRKVFTVRRGLTTTQLYEGPSRLLVVESGLGEDQYRRFYYDEIEACAHHRSWRWFYHSLIYLLLGFCLFIPLFFIVFTNNRDLLPLLIAPSVILSIPIIVIIVTLFGGGQVVVTIRTHVGETPLPPIAFRKARKLLERISPLILAAQPAMHFPAAPPAPPTSGATPAS